MFFSFAFSELVDSADPAVVSFVSRKSVWVRVKSDLQESRDKAREFGCCLRRPVLGEHFTVTKNGYLLGAPKWSVS